MSIATPPTFRLSNSVIRSPEGKIKFRRFSPNGYEHYHIGVWLESDDPEGLNLVSEVEYELHPTFATRVRRSRNRANNFSITFWSWGTFRVKAKVFLVDRDEPIFVEHDLQYDLPADDSAYVEVSA
jgi:transcription initiation factor IIF auxiliary subunit